MTKNVFIVLNVSIQSDTAAAFGPEKLRAKP